MYEREDLLCQDPEEAEVAEVLVEAPVAEVAEEDSTAVLTAEDLTVDIITMDWLCENILGKIPSLDDFLPQARQIVRLQGIGSREQQWKQ